MADDERRPRGRERVILGEAERKEVRKKERSESLARPVADDGVSTENPTWLELGGLTAAVFLSTLALSSLVLALIGHLEGWAALLVAVVSTVAFLVVARRLKTTWSFAPWSWLEAGILAAILLVSAVQFFPGAPLAAKNRDPGVYINSAVAIARDGTTSIKDPVFDDVGREGVHVAEVDGQLDPRLVTSIGDLPWHKRTYRGFPVDPDDGTRLRPSFFHLWPATLATGYDLGGRTLMFNMTPVFMLTAVALLFLATRRAFGLVAATVTGSLLMVNMLEVWQAKFPTAEALSQFLYGGALLAVALALRTRSRTAAGVGGFLVGMGFVARPEGLFVALFALGVVALLWALEAVDGRVIAFTVGLVPLFVFGLYEAYVEAADYSASQKGLPGFRLVALGLVLIVVGAFVIRFARSRRFTERLRQVPPARAAQWAGLAVAILLILFFAFAWFRPQILGTTYHIDKEGESARAYDEINLQRLSWFTSIPVMGFALLALLYGAYRRWSATVWAVLLPGLLIMPVLIWEPRIAPNLMWWGRRYVPVVIPTLMMLAGAFAAFVWARRGDHQKQLRIATVAVVVVLCGLMFRHADDLWGHREFDGSMQVIDQLDDLAGDDDVFVWKPLGDQTANFGMAPVTWLGLPSLMGPPRITDEVMGAYADAFGGRTVFLVTESPDPPPQMEDSLELVRHIDEDLTVFEQTLEERPNGPFDPIPVDLYVWRYTGGAAASDTNPAA